MFIIHGLSLKEILVSLDVLDVLLYAVCFLHNSLTGYNFLRYSTVMKTSNMTQAYLDFRIGHYLLNFIFPTLVEFF